MHQINIRFVFILCVALCYLQGIAQTPTPQDCPNAIPICKDVYVEPSPYKYSGNGINEFEIFQYKQCITDEDNGVWYIFTAQTDGALRFSITPDDPIDDYDWIVFDITNGSCADLATPDVMDFMISSNNYGAGIMLYDGRTGANSDSVPEGYTGNCYGPGDFNGPKWNPDIPVSKGNTYVLYNSNWSGSSNGYTIDFSASTAQIYDNIGPKLKEIEKADDLYCGTNKITIRFSEKVQCSDISPDIFAFTGNQANTIVSATSSLCEQGAITARDFEIEFEYPLEPGYYTISLTQPVFDACNNSGILNSVEFEIQKISVHTKKHAISCYNASDGIIDIQAHGGEGLLFSIDNGETFLMNNGEFTDLDTGTYYIVVKNNAGCEQRGDTITLKNPEPIEFNMHYTDTLKCFGDANGKIEITATGGTGIRSYSINNGNSFSANNGYFKNLEAGEYQVMVKDGNNCQTQTKKAEIKQPDEIKVSLREKQDINCYGYQDGWIEIQASGGTGTLFYAINGAEYTANNIFNKLAPGNYRITVRDSNLCTVNYGVVGLSSPDSLMVASYNITEPNCHGNKNGAIEIDITGGVKPYTINWFDKDENKIGTVEKLYAGKYAVHIEDANNCITTDTFTILQPDSFQLNAQVKDVTCYNGSDGAIEITIQGGTPPYRFVWSNDNKTEKINNLISGNYTIQLRDDHDCSISETFFVDQPTGLSVQLMPQNITCYGKNDGAIDAEIIGGQGVFRYVWSNGDTTQNITRLSPDNYKITVTDVNMQICAVAVASVIEPDSISIRDSLKMSCYGNTDGAIHLNIQGGTPPYYTQCITRNTSFTDSLIELKPDSYQIIVEDANLCTKTRNYIINSVECPSIIIVPNIFTPNNDGRNDFFNINYKHVKKTHISIYNRWGQILFESNDLKNGWNGKIQDANRKAPEGVYFYDLKAIGKDNIPYRLQGFLHLMR